MGVGKSTLARGIAARRRLALNLDIDDLRMRLGEWRDEPASKQIARSLGFGLASSHLQDGHDVVLPALICRFEVIDHVAAIAAAAGATFTEVVLVAPVDEILARLVTSRSVQAPHPRDGVQDDEFREHVEFALRELRQRASTRPGVHLIHVAGMDSDAALARVCSAIAW